MEARIKKEEHRWGKQLVEAMTIPYRRGKKRGEVSLDYEYELLHPKNSKQIQERYINNPGPRPKYNYYRIDPGILNERLEELQLLKRSISSNSYKQRKLKKAVDLLSDEDPVDITPLASKAQMQLIKGLYIQKIEEAQSSAELLLAANSGKQGIFEEASQELYGQVTESDFNLALRESARFLGLKSRKAHTLSPQRFKKFSAALTDAYDALHEIGLPEQVMYIPPMQSSTGGRLLSPEEQYKILSRAGEYINEVLVHELPYPFQLTVEHEPSRATFAITYKAEEGLLTGALLKVPSTRRRLHVVGRGYSLNSAFEHEINTHMLRMVNGIANGLAIMESMPYHGFTEEGLAQYNTEKTNGILDLPPGLQAPKKALPIVLMGACRFHRQTFQDIFNLATRVSLPGQLINHPPKLALQNARTTAYNMTFRAKRGTSGGYAVYTKDLLYFDGKKEILKIIEDRGRVPDFLYAGKVSIQQEGVLKALGLEKPPLGRRFDIPTLDEIAAEVGVKE